MKPLATAALAAALLATTAAPASASLSGSLDVGVRLIEQPASQPWEVNLLLGGALKATDEILPPTSKLSFRFPPASVNTAAAATCTAAKPGIIGRLDVKVCPASSRIGRGTAHVRAGDALIDARVDIFRGPGTDRRLTLFVVAEAGQILGITVTMRGTLQKVSDGQFGYRFDMPVPPIPFGSSERVRLADFALDVGVRRRVGGRSVPFIQAPRSCPKGGFPFSMAWTMGSRTVTDRKSIKCVIEANAD